MGVVKTRPLSSQSGPADSRFLSCRALCFLRESAAATGGAVDASPVDAAVRERGEGGKHAGMGGDLLPGRRGAWPRYRS